MFLTRSLGPFRSEEEFNTELADTYIAKPKGQVGPYIRNIVNTHKHKLSLLMGTLNLTTLSLSMVV
jgi:hypothetical protein